MANNKVAKKEQSSNVVDISLLLEDAETGHNMSNDDMMIPRLRILQDGSPQTKKREGEYVEGAEAGHIFDSVSRNIYDGEKGITVVTVSYRTTYIEWKADRKGLVADHGNKPELLNNCTQSDKGKYFTPLLIPAPAAYSSGLKKLTPICPHQGRSSWISFISENISARPSLSLPLLILLLRSIYSPHLCLTF